MKKTVVKKVVLLGNSGVGKTSIIKRFITGVFDKGTRSSKMAAFINKEIEAANCTFKLQIWDTMGQEKYGALTSYYYKDAHIVIFVYDKTCYKSFVRVKTLVNSVLSDCVNNPFLCINKNKIDKEGQNVPESEVLEFARLNNIYTTETSAKTGENVQELFKEIVRMIDLKEVSTKQKKTPEDQSVKILRETITRKKKKKRFC